MPDKMPEPRMPEQRMSERNASEQATIEQQAEDRNEVRLVGRLSGRAERRPLPSGDELAELRVVVRRHGGGADTLPVQLGPAPPAGSRKGRRPVGRRDLAAALRLEPGRRVRVVGSLRRRWWQAGGARRSRVEVAATSVVPLPDAAPDTSASAVATDVRDRPAPADRDASAPSGAPVR